ncbi:MAG: cytidylyltransferase domain-containing protein [Planctomycetota bacterium]|jgi:spore coat polysaccharide biosynthesis protein SpsF
MSKAIVIVQARLGSTRLPQKVLKPIGDRCLLKWVLDRVSRAKEPNQIVVATSTAKEDDQIEQRCRDWSIPCFRGSENDVLKRFVDASCFFDADLVIRVNADNPFIDPYYIDELIEDILQRRFEYESFELSTGQPVMLTAISFFAEAITAACLQRADKIITNPFEREHVTLGIYQRPEVFKVHFINVPPFCDNANIRLTIDTQQDYKMLKDLFALLNDEALTVSSKKLTEIIMKDSKWFEQMKKLNTLNPKTIRK